MLNRGKKTKGVTTAAVIWVLAGVGAFIGFNKFGAAIGLTLLTVFVLSILGRVENYINNLLRKRQADANDDDDD